MQPTRIFKYLIFFMLGFVLSCSKPVEENIPDQIVELAEPSAREEIPDTSQLAGEFFGVPVPIGNYYFAKTAVLSFSAKWRGKTPQTEEELEELTWQELLLSFEAFRRGIQATPEEKSAEIEKILQAEKVSFDWKTDRQAYEDWVTENLKVSVEFFENLVEHLVKLEKLRLQVIDGIEPEVSEEEARQKFLDEYNSLSVELVQFDDLKEAQDFYEQAAMPTTEKDLEDLIWQDLVFSLAALQRGIEVEASLVDGTIKYLLIDLDVDFNWQTDKDDFKAWLEDDFNLSEEDFRARIAHLVKVDILRQKIFQGEEPEVNEADYQEFLKDSRSVEKAYSNFFDKHSEGKDMLRFDTFNNAKEFYKKIDRGPGAWQEERRRKPKSFKRPGFVALDFLINIWGFQREGAYDMLKEPPGSFYTPFPIYKGYGAFKILKIRRANPEGFEPRKEGYFELVRNIKKHKAFGEWKEELKRSADVKVYITPDSMPDKQKEGDG